MSGSTTYTGQTLAGMGVTVGNYDWIWGSGLTFYKVTLEIIPPITPTNTQTPTVTPTNTITPTNTV
jgi:hypothetical protein